MCIRDSLYRVDLVQVEILDGFFNLSLRQWPLVFLIRYEIFDRDLLEVDIRNKSCLLYTSYCRVSTDSEEQLVSYANQKKVYTEICLLYTSPFMRTYVKALQNSRTDAPKPFLLVIEEINRANAVSYTHLDVYKRQL